jgi:hypothetical protein
MIQMYRVDKYYFELLPLKWMDEILEKTEFDILEKHKRNLVAIIMDLLMYQNMKVVDRSFTLFN